MDKACVPSKGGAALVAAESDMDDMDPMDLMDPMDPPPSKRSILSCPQGPPALFPS